MFKNRTFTLSVVASISVGVAMFGTAVFLAQYMQLARGATPTQSGLLTIPMMGGLLIASTVFGGIISRSGKWKSIMVGGGALTVIGSLLLSTLAYDTSLVLVGRVHVRARSRRRHAHAEPRPRGAELHRGERPRRGYQCGDVLPQPRRHLGVSVLGSILGTFVAQHIKDGIPRLSPADQAAAVQTLGSGTIPHISQLPKTIATLVESAYGSGVGSVFLYSVPLAVITLLAVIFIPNATLGTKNAVQLKHTAEKTPTAGAEPAVVPAGHGHGIEDAEATLTEVTAASAALADPTGPIDQVEPDARPKGGRP